MIVLGWIFGHSLVDSLGQIHQGLDGDYVKNSLKQSVIFIAEPKLINQRGSWVSNQLHETDEKSLNWRLFKTSLNDVATQDRWWADQTRHQLKDVVQIEEANETKMHQGQQDQTFN